MTPVVCRACGLRFGPTISSCCPQCDGPLATLQTAEEAVGLRLFTAPAVSVPALAAAIAVRRRTWSAPHA